MIFKCLNNYKYYFSNFKKFDILFYCCQDICIFFNIILFVYIKNQERSLLSVIKISIKKLKIRNSIIFVCQ